MLLFTEISSKYHKSYLLVVALTNQPYPFLRRAKPIKHFSKLEFILLAKNSQFPSENWSKRTPFVTLHELSSLVKHVKTVHPLLSFRNVSNPIQASEILSNILPYKLWLSARRLPGPSRPHSAFLCSDSTN